MIFLQSVPGLVNIKIAWGTNKLWNINKPEKLKKKSKKSVDKAFTAWYNNKAVGREYETKGNHPIQKVSWKLNNALNKPLKILWDQFLRII